MSQKILTLREVKPTKAVLAALLESQMARKASENRYARMAKQNDEIREKARRVVRVTAKMMPRLCDVTTAERLARACAHIVQMAEAKVCETGPRLVAVPNIGVARAIKVGKLNATANTVEALAKRGRSGATYRADAARWRTIAETIARMTTAEIRNTAKATKV